MLTGVSILYKMHNGTDRVQSVPVFTPLPQCFPSLHTVGFPLKDDLVL